MPTNTTPEFPTLLPADEAIKQEEANAAARKAAADAEHWQRVALALRLIEQAGYTSMAARLLDDDQNAHACRSAIAVRIVRTLGLPGAPDTQTYDRSLDTADRLIDIAANGLVKAETHPTARRRITNLIAHGSPDAPGSA